MEAVNQVDVVICAVSSKQVLEQKPLIRIIKQSGPIKVLNNTYNQSAVRLSYFIKFGLKLFNQGPTLLID